MSRISRTIIRLLILLACLSLLAACVPVPASAPTHHRRPGRPFERHRPGPGNQRGDPLSRPYERASLDKYLVPVALIAESTPARISLSCSRAELAECQPFEKTVLVGVDGAELEDIDMDYALASTYATMPGAEYPGPMMPPTLQEEQLPAGELSLHPGASVEATDGHVGHVQEFVIDPQNDRVTHLVLREGHLWGKKDVTIPLDQIDRIEADVVYLKLDKAAVEHLPSVRAR